MNKLPEKIELDIHGETIEFSLTDKREIKYYGKSKTSNESLWRTDKLDDNEVFYQTEWGWGVFVTVEERELSLEERAKWLEDNKGYDLLVGNLDHDHIREVVEEEAPTKLIKVTYNDKTLESYE
jgi:hypothetical protein